MTASQTLRNKDTPGERGAEIFGIFIFGKVFVTSEGKGFSLSVDAVTHQAGRDDKKDI